MSIDNKILQDIKDAFNFNNTSDNDNESSSVQESNETFSEKLEQLNKSISETKEKGASLNVEIKTDSSMEDIVSQSFEDSKKEPIREKIDIEKEGIEVFDEIEIINNNNDEKDEKVDNNESDSIDDLFLGSEEKDDKEEQGSNDEINSEEEQISNEIPEKTEIESFINTLLSDDEKIENSKFTNDINDKIVNEEVNEEANEEVNEESPDNIANDKEEEKEEKEEEKEEKEEVNEESSNNIINEEEEKEEEKIEFEKLESEIKDTVEEKEKEEEVKREENIKPAMKDGKIQWQTESPSPLYDSFYAIKKQRISDISGNSTINCKKLREELKGCWVDTSTQVLDRLVLCDKLYEVVQCIERVRQIKIEIDHEYYLWKRFTEILRGSLAKVQCLKPALKQDGLVGEHMGDVEIYLHELMALHNSVASTTATLDKMFDAVSRKVSVAISIEERDYDRVENRAIKQRSPSGHYDEINMGEKIEDKKKKTGEMDWFEL